MPTEAKDVHSESAAEKELKMKRLDSMSIAEKAMTQIEKGAFLTAKAENRLNTMTIGWATIGVVWSKPIFMVAVRNSRFTFGIMERAADFTVSIPKSGLKDELAFCGTQSGRTHDKYKECGLEPASAQKTLSPIIRIPGIHFECRIVFKAPMDPKYLAPEYQKLYPQKDYHTLYFGEIVECYEI